MTVQISQQADLQAVKTVSTIEREQLEVDFAKKVLWEMIDKGQLFPQKGAVSLALGVGWSPHTHEACIGPVFCREGKSEGTLSTVLEALQCAVQPLLYVQPGRTR